jgi:nucleotide-binding universal stress UspA family protein
MSAIHTVVAGIDFSENARDAVDAARELVRLRHGHVHLVHVVPDVRNSPWTVEAPGLDLEAVQRSWSEDAEERLAGLTAEWMLDPRSVTTAVTCGTPAAEIVRYAAEQGADAIVLGSHGHGLVRRFVLGSVADRVIRHASCPVLVVPHRALRQPAAEAPAELAG